MNGRKVVKPPVEAGRPTGHPLATAARRRTRSGDGTSFPLQPTRAPMDNLVQDVRYAFRSLRSRPTVFVVAALSLAIGISANTVVFAALDAYLVRPLPYE